LSNENFTNEQSKIQSISQNIMESEHGYFFLKLLSELPNEEKSKIIAEDPRNLNYLTHKENNWLQMKCTNCEKKEKSEKEFQKCSRCETVYYCGKACQRSHWKYHKSKCKNKKNKIIIND
jgi:hypothetical protein